MIGTRKNVHLWSRSRSYDGLRCGHDTQDPAQLSSRHTDECLCILVQNCLRKAPHSSGAGCNVLCGSIASVGCGASDEISQEHLALRHCTDSGGHHAQTDHDCDLDRTEQASRCCHTTSASASQCDVWVARARIADALKNGTCTELLKFFARHLGA